MTLRLNSLCRIFSFQCTLDSLGGFWSLVDRSDGKFVAEFAGDRKNLFVCLMLENKQLRTGPLLSIVNVIEEKSGDILNSMAMSIEK